MFYFRYINPSNEYRLIFLRIFLIVEFCSLSLVFYHNLTKKIVKQIILYVPIFFISFSIIDYIISDRDKFSFVPLVAECLILLIYIIYFFYEKIQVNTFVPIYQTNMFWIAVAFTIYFSGNFFLFLYSNNAVKNDQFRFQYTLIYSTFAILKNILLCIGIVIKQPKEDTKHQDFITLQNFLDLAKNQEKN